MEITTPDWPLTLFYDGECPLCLREIHLFQRRADPSRLELIDIADPAVEPLPGLAREDMLGCLHARFRDGQLVTGIDATYWSYRAAGLGWLVTPLAWRWARPVWKWSYRQFCHLRPVIARILPMPATGASCDSGRCRPRRHTD